MPSGAPDARRRLPQVDALASLLEPEAGPLPRPVIVAAVRDVVDAARRAARRTDRIPSEDELVAAARDELRRRRARLLRPVINATGVILHTNLGRAPLSAQAARAVAEIASGYSNLEWDAEHGRRGDRFVHVEPLLALATGAEAALVVNNNAAAVLLVCAAVAAGREVIVSRGELVEIGGEFRVPDVLAASGAVLREVGTTNRTHLRDYERALGEHTAAILRVHPSNYRVVGFIASPAIEELSGLAHRHNVPLLFDAGSGLLGDRIADEPVVAEALTAGADVVCFSGDKLFAGPQAGIIAGRRRIIDTLRTHPLLRALRPDKMQLAALQSTVLAHLDGRSGELPVRAMVSAPVADIRRRARSLARALEAAGYQASVSEAESVVGGGSLPGHGIETVVVSVRHADLAASGISARLREHDPSVVARVEDGAVVVDLRTVTPEQDADVRAAFGAG